MLPLISVANVISASRHGITPAVSGLNGEFPAVAGAHADPSDGRHRYASDLDIWGEHGLLARLQTGGGPLADMRLRAWLDQADAVDGSAQQRLVRALVSAHSWRAALAVDADAGDTGSKAADPVRIAEWLQTTAAGPNIGLVAASWIIRLAALAAIAGLAVMAGGGGVVLGVLGVALLLTPIDAFAGESAGFTR